MREACYLRNEEREEGKRGREREREREEGGKKEGEREEGGREERTKCHQRLSVDLLQFVSHLAQ